MHFPFMVLTHHNRSKEMPCEIHNFYLYKFLAFQDFIMSTLEKNKAQIQLLERVGNIWLHDVGMELLMLVGTIKH
jgi:hypothetical protein